MGPLAGLRVVELDHVHVAFAGKLLADLGAEVTVVEPPGGSPQRTYGPFLDDEPGPERSLWWWHYHTSKHSVVVDPVADHDALRRLVRAADVVLVGELPSPLGATREWAEQLTADAPGVVIVSITPYGTASARHAEPVTDLTLLAEGGPVWSCGYDDHTLPPVRGGGNQSLHIAGHWAAMALLVAILAREETGQGQFIDVSMHAAANVTTEMASYAWLAAGMEVQRQTGRHASPVPTAPVQVRCRDGRYATTGVPPRDPREFAAIIAELDRRGWRTEFPDTAVLELAAEREEPINFADIETDPLVLAMVMAARDVVWFLAEHLDALEFFTLTQGIGLTTGVIYTPGEVMADPHLVDRGFPVSVDHPELGRSFRYPGAPYRFGSTPWAARRAPRLGEHQARLGR